MKQGLKHVWELTPYTLAIRFHNEDLPKLSFEARVHIANCIWKVTTWLLTISPKSIVGNPLASKSQAYLQLLLCQCLPPVFPVTEYFTRRVPEQVLPRARLFLTVCLGYRKPSSQRCLWNTLDTLRSQWKLTFVMENLLWSPREVFCRNYQMPHSSSSRTWYVLWESCLLRQRNSKNKQKEKRKKYFWFSSQVLSFGSFGTKAEARTGKGMVFWDLK